MNYEIEIYSLDVVSGLFERIDIINTFQNLSFFNKLNGIGSCQFSLNVYDKKANKQNLIRWKNQIAIKRNDQIVYFGPISVISGDYNGISGKITIQSHSFLSHLTARNTNKIKIFKNTEQCQIAWDLISETQAKENGNLGIVQGSTPNSVRRDRTYEYKCIADALVQLTEVINGFDFLFDAVVDGNNLLTNVLFNTYYPIKGEVKLDIQAFEIGKNINKIQFQTKSNLINSGIAEGSGSGNTLIATKDLPNLQKAYTRREVVDIRNDVSIYSTLKDSIDKILTDDSVERFIIDLKTKENQTPSFDDYSLGDILTLNISVDDSGGYIDFKSKKRVVEIAVDVDNQGVETITPKFDIIG